MSVFANTKKRRISESDDKEPVISESDDKEPVI